MSLAQQAARGAAWTIVFGLGARAIGLTGTLLMTHLVAPDVVGEVGAATIVVMAFSWLTSWGFGQYAIVKGRGDAAYLRGGPRGNCPSLARPRRHGNREFPCT